MNLLHDVCKHTYPNKLPEVKETIIVLVLVECSNKQTNVDDQPGPLQQLSNWSTSANGQEIMLKFKQLHPQSGNKHCALLAVFACFWAI